MGRGCLTEVIKQKSKELLGYEINQTELRLLPYIQYIVMNNGQVDRSKMNTEEEQIIAKWEELGHVDWDFMGLSVTKKFWDAMNELLFLGYVACDNEEYITQYTKDLGVAT